jgi:hypothetical protein
MGDFMGWHYSINGVQTGPVSPDEIKKLVAIGTLTPSDLIWSEGMQQWTPIGRVPLFSAPAADPAAPLMAIPLSYSMAPPKSCMGLSIASMVCGICGFVFYAIPGIVGLILGIIALFKIKKSGNPAGKGFAIAGVATGGASLLLYGFIILMVVLAVRRGGGWLPTPAPSAGYSLSSTGSCSGNLLILLGQYNTYVAINDAPPSSLGDLAVTMNLNPDLFICPENVQNMKVFIGDPLSPEEFADWIDLNADYILFDQSDIVFAEKPGLHPGSLVKAVRKSGAITYVSPGALPIAKQPNLEK